ncbi:Nn.00g043190.m01.CDS01 [Neocucurbitaria sp. VM-36]
MPHATPIMMPVTHPIFLLVTHLGLELTRARLARPFGVKLPSRSSLAAIGIPDHRDALAIYFRWVRQRYYRAHALMGPELADSVCPASESNELHASLSPALGMPFDMNRLAVDVSCVGARFEGEALKYAREIDVVG